MENSLQADLYCTRNIKIFVRQEDYDSKLKFEYLSRNKNRNGINKSYFLN